MVENCVDGNGGLAGGTISDDQLALSSPDGNHRVDRHNSRLDRLADALPFDDSESNVLDRIKFCGFNWTFAIQRLSERVDNTSEKSFSHGSLQESARRLDLIAFANRGIVAEDDRAHLRLFEIQRQAVNSTGKFQHLVKHRSTETFNFRDAIADLADYADISLSGGFAVNALDLAFEFLQNIAHGWIGLKLLRKAGEAAADTSVPHIASELDAESAEKVWRGAELSRDIVAKLFFQSVDDVLRAPLIQR